MRRLVKSKNDARLRRARKHRLANIGQANQSNKVSKPVIIIQRSNQHIYAQVVNFEDHKSKVIAQASTNEKGFSATGSKSDRAKAVGTLLGERAKKAGVKDVIFDRNGFKYHGRVKALAEGARESGMQF